MWADSEVATRGPVLADALRDSLIKDAAGSYGWPAAKLLPAGLDENGSASFAEDVSACLHADAKRRRLMTAVTDRRAPKCFL